jgi:molecular chaperone DnaK (HSP70)
MNPINNDISDNKNINDFNNICLGIDFGTTNSCLSIWYKNKSILIPDIDGNDVIPTVIEINLDKKIIGKQAYLRKEIFGSDTVIAKKNIFLVYEIKKLLGKKYSELNKKHLEMLAYEIKPDSDDNILIVDNESLKTYYPEEIATHLFMSFKHKAEMFLSKKFNFPIIINKSVISVPAYFNKNQRLNIKNSAEYAGLNVLRLINEPTAAAICYGLGKISYGDTGLNIIVFDFGGGTLDVSVLNINDGVYEVLGSCGNNNLGGSDFDTKIMEYIINEFITQNKIFYEEFINNITENSLQKLKFLCEQAKIALSDNTNTKIKINNFYNEIELSVNLSRDKFNEICQDLIRIIVKPLFDVLDICELDKSNIDEIIMVGGMTRVPIVRYNIERFFNKDVNCSINPDNVVSIGAGIHGFMLINNDSIKDKLLLIDRTSLSIGLETSGGIMDVLISRGSIIPVKKTKKYSTDTDYVDSIDIKIFEGERKFTKDNFLIGDFTLSGIEKQKKGIPSIQITFSVDSDGIIKISAEDLDNPFNKKSIQVSGNKQNLSQVQIDEIIENAKQMDQSDKIDKIKKESYMYICDSSIKIIDNLSNDLVKIPEQIKNEIISNVTEIYNWILALDYQSIEVDRYKEILHDYKINYSIYILQQSTPILELDASNLEEEKDKGIEIYDDDIETKKYEEQINYFRKVIDEYENIGKQIKIVKFMDNSKYNSQESLENLENLQKLFDELFNYAYDTLCSFFIEKNLTGEIVDEYVNNLFNLDVQFKEKFSSFEEEFNIVNKLIKKLEEKENYYLNLLENINKSIGKKNKKFNRTNKSNKSNKSGKKHNKKNNKIYNGKSTQNKNKNKNSSLNLQKKNIKSITDKLDIIIEFQSVIYKMNSGYINVDIDKLTNMLSHLNNLH